MTNNNFPSGGHGRAFGQSNPTVGRYLPGIITAAVGTLVTLIGLFLPFVSVSNDYMSASASIADFRDSTLIALSWLAIILAAGTCVTLFFNDKIKVPDGVFGTLLIVSGAIVLRNWVANINPTGGARSIGGAYGIDISRGIGYWLYLLGAILLLAAGGLLIYLANKTLANAPQQAYYNPGQPYGQAPQQPGPYPQHYQQPPYPNQPYQYPQQYQQPGGPTEPPQSPQQ
ncbi:MAG: hypothetical protein Q3979_08390 [Actinomycetaceae bacterium]|nr:hypothetical protein [Actinomycetaceae bacterium]